MLDNEASAQARASLAKAALHEHVAALRAWFAPRRFVGKTQDVVKRKVSGATADVVSFASEHRVPAAVGVLGIVSAVAALFKFNRSKRGRYGRY